MQRVMIGNLWLGTRERHQTRGRNVVPCSDYVDVSKGPRPLFGDLDESSGEVRHIYAVLVGPNEHGELASYLWEPPVEALAALVLTGAQGERLQVFASYGVVVEEGRPGIYHLATREHGPRAIVV